MEKLLLAFGIAILGGAIVAIGLYAWNGYWGPVLLALGAAFIGKLALGLVEVILTPISLSMIYFAKRGNALLSACSALLLGLAGRAAFTVYCALVLLYFVRTPGPPEWLAVVLSIVVAAAPFAWASQRTQDDAHPSHFDLLAALLGVAIAGTLLLLDIRPLIALLPVATLFLISAAGFVIWWTTKGSQRLRRESLLAARSEK